MTKKVKVSDLSEFDQQDLQLEQHGQSQERAHRYGAQPNVCGLRRGHLHVELFGVSGHVELSHRGGSRKSALKAVL